MLLNKGLQMLKQLWELMQGWNTPLENPRWFGHCYHGDTVVLERGMVQQTGPYENNSSISLVHLRNEKLVIM